MELSRKDWKNIFYLIVIFGIWLFGFYLGRTIIKVDKPDPDIVYIPGDTIRDSIPKPIPFYVEAPVDTADIIKQCVKDGIYYELFPEKTKTVTEYIEVTKDDTTAIMRDWATKRAYSEVLFDSDTIGNCTVNIETQYNRVNNIDYTFVPVIKTITYKEETIKLFSPYVGGGVMLNPWDDAMNPIVNVKAGFFIKEKHGIQLDAGHALKSKEDFIGISYVRKF